MTPRDSTFNVAQNKFARSKSKKVFSEHRSHRPANSARANAVTLKVSSPSFFPQLYILHIYMLRMLRHTAWNIPLASVGQQSAMPPPSFPGTWQHEQLKSPRLPRDSWKLQYIINTVFTPNPKHSTTPATRKKINSIPAETRTGLPLTVENSRRHSLQRAVCLLDHECCSKVDVLRITH